MISVNMTKQVAESTNRITTVFLKEHGYLPQEESYKAGRIIWTSSSGWQNDINTIVQTSGKEPETIDTSYIRLSYVVNARSFDEKTDMNYKMPIVTTPCNYGGKRYWFICNLSKNSVYCGRRVGVLYPISKYFGCRYCAEVAYVAQFQGGRFRTSSVCEPDVERAYMDIKTFYYNGKPTRRYKRYLRLRDKMDMSWNKMFMKFYETDPEFAKQLKKR